MKIEPNYLIAIGAAITIIGGVLAAFGTFQLNRSTSKENRKVTHKIDEQMKEIKFLNDQNSSLQKKINELNLNSNNQEERIKELSKQNFELSIQLSRSTETLYGNITGGDSFGELIVTPIDHNKAELMLISHGKYPLYELSLRIVDIELIKTVKIRTMDDIYKTQPIISVGNMQVSSALPLGKLSSDFTHSYKEFNIFFDARNGFFVQNIKLSKKENSWVKSTSITNLVNNKLLFEKTDPDFPENLLNAK